MRLLVVGCGSVGKRHIGNLVGLGVREIAAVDKRPDRLQEVKERFGVSALYSDLDEALAATPHDGALVCTPTAAHVAVASKALARGCHVFVEKPISHALEGVEQLLEHARSKGRTVMVGYSYRFWPPLMKVKELVDSGVLGRLYSSRVVFSEYLPDWHPWEDYRSWFMARKEDGGGALLDESHTLDFVRWMFGEVEEVGCINGKVSHLEITSDDLADMVVKFRSGMVGTVHMDIFGRASQKSLEVAGERGNLRWDFYANKVELYQAEEKKWEVFPFSCERNQMFLDEARCFLECIQGSARPRVDGWDALKTLKVIAAAQRSSQARRFVLVEE